MAGRIGRWAASLGAMAAVAALGAGVYAGGPFATASELTPVLATPAPSAPPSPPPEPLPEPSPTPSPAAPAPAAPPTGQCARTGPTQLAVEQYLAAHPEFGPVVVDGQQSAVDCAAIKNFQLRYGISGAGLAGPVSGRVVTRLANAAIDRCDTTPGLRICVDLTSQTMWVVRDGVVVYGPTPVRTGRAGLATPAGHYSIHDKKRRTISSIFHVPMPYWQRFNGEMGFHQTPSYLYEGGSPGSHGCINLLRRDAVELFSLTSRGTPVHIFGEKPGT